MEFEPIMLLNILYTDISCNSNKTSTYYVERLIDIFNCGIKRYKITTYKQKQIWKWIEKSFNFTWFAPNDSRIFYSSRKFENFNN